MGKTNSENIKKTDIAVGIPSYNEENNIARVTKNVDEGLQISIVLLIYV